MIVTPDLNLLVTSEDYLIAIANTKSVAKTVFTAIGTKTIFAVRVRLGRNVINSYGFTNSVLETTLTSQHYQAKLNQIMTAFYQAGFVPDQVENNLVSLIRTD